MIRQFTQVDGLVAPLDRANVDTDAIIQKQFLKSIKRSGFGPNAFDEWRYLDHGEPGQDCASRPPNPDFVLNQPRYTFGLLDAAARIEAAVKKGLAQGVRTGDIAEPGMRAVGTREMGDAVLAAL